MTSDERRFRQFNLNQWVAGGNKWLDMNKWSGCNLPMLPPEELEGLPCWGSLDLSNTSDITAYVLLFKLDDGTYQVMPEFWIPEGYATQCDRKGHTKYLQWARAGYIRLTQGDLIDHAFAEKRIIELSDRFNPSVIRFDPWNSTRTAVHLVNQGLNLEQMRQGFPSLNEPTKYLEWLIGSGLIRHGNNPVLTWMAGNAVLLRGSEGEVRLSKGKSQNKIDGISALVMAVAAATLGAAPPQEADFFFV